MSTTPTLVFLDSFDHYDTNHIISKWTLGGGEVGTAFGRNGQGMNLGAGSGAVSKTVPPQSNFTVGWAVKINIGQGLGGFLWTLSCLTGSGGLATLAQLSIGDDGTFITWAGNNVIDNPKAFTYSPSTWAYVELEVQLGGSTPISVNITLRVNGQQISNAGAPSNVNLSGLMNTTQALGNVHRFSGAVNLGSTWIDDLYIATGGGFFGDVRIGCIYPRIDQIMNFTPSSGSNGFSLLNEHPSPTYSGPAPDDDATYIFDDITTDAYQAFFDMITTLTDEVQAVQFNIYARKDDEGSRAITPYIGGFQDVMQNWFYLSDNYFYHTFPYTVDPAGGGDWSPALINGTAFGLIITL
jgi:hypothetical protein